MLLTPARYPIAINRPSVLLWTAITVVFLFERTYLIQKAGLPHMLGCVLVRVVLLLLLCHVHNYRLTPLLTARKYGPYALFTGIAVGSYLLLQGGYDHYLFGFVIGDQERAGLGQNLPYNTLTTIWYLLLTYLVKRAIDPVSLPSRITEPALKTDGQTIAVKTGTQWVRLPVNKVLYAQGLKDYTRLFTQEETFVLKGSIGTVVTQLPDGVFVRVHKSYLVARQHIQSVSRRAVRVPGHVVPVGRLYAQSVLDEFTR